MYIQSRITEYTIDNILLKKSKKNDTIANKKVNGGQNAKRR